MLESRWKSLPNTLTHISGANEPPNDQPIVHNIDNLTGNNDTSDSTIDNETNNQLENAKNILNGNNSDSNPKVSTPAEATTFHLISG